MVHRDIKPANILVRADGKVKITDFGIARLPTHPVTKTGSTMGTLSYMAPEQLQAQKVTGRADQYALAVVAYRMLCGRLPFAAESEAPLMLKILSDEAPPVHETNPAIPRARLAVILGFAAILSGLWMMVPSYIRAQQLARSIEAEQLTDPDQIWARWRELSGGNSSSLLLNGPRKVVKQKFAAAADQVIETYRNNDSQAVYEKDWERARTMAARAFAPDPELGLARIYVYGLKDTDRAYEALQEAQKRGYALGNRDRQLLADGYRERADRVWWDSRNMRGLPAEKDQVQKAVDDYKRAEGLYQSIAPWGASTQSLVRVRAGLGTVNFRLQEIDRQQKPH